MKKDITKYYCSKHGNNGQPDCPECWKHLYELVGDYNGVIVEEDGEIRN